jgi:hypothetical protein
MELSHTLDGREARRPSAPGSRRRIVEGENEKPNGGRGLFYIIFIQVRGVNEKYRIAIVQIRGYVKNNDLYFL